jgi:hypothetical protein
MINNVVDNDQQRCLSESMINVLTERTEPLSIPSLSSFDLRHTRCIIGLVVHFDVLRDEVTMEMYKDIGMMFWKAIRHDLK